MLQGNAVPPAQQNYGDDITGPWVFGMAWHHDGITELRLLVVPKRDKRTLLPLIIKHIIPGTEIWSDEWKAYESLRQHGFLHKTVNHSENFVKSRDRMQYTKN